METVLTHLTLADSLRKAATSGKQITFVKSGDSHHPVTYRDFYNDAVRWASLLLDMGLKEKEEMVIIINDNELFLKIFWACILAKIVVIPIAPGSQEIHKQKVLKILHQLEHPWIFADDSFYRDFDKYLEKCSPDTTVAFRRIETSDINRATTGKPPKLPPIFEEDIAYIQYSSGSTGDPKGVILTHGNLMSNTSAIAARLGISPADTALAWLPLTHDMGMICFHLTNVWSACDQVVMPTTLFIKRPLLWMDLATRFKATLLYSPNFGFQYLMKSIATDRVPEDWQLHNVRVIVNGAEPISEKITKEFLHLLHNCGLKVNAVFPGYGLAEASVAVTLPDLEHQLSFVYCKRKQLKPGDHVIICQPNEADSLSFANCGYPVDDCQIRITDEQDQVLPASMVGNIQVKGGNVTRGYYKQPEYTKPITSDGWLKTGDLGFLYNNSLIVTGRKKNIIIVNGQNYYPQDIEQLVEHALDIRPGNVVAIGIASPETSAQIAIFVLFKGNETMFAEHAGRVREILAQHLDIYPDYILPVRNIPKTTSGKVMHYRLKEELLLGAFNEQIAAMENLEQQKKMRENSTDIPGTLLQLLRQIGMSSQYSPDDNLFNAGMSSLKALSLINALSQHKYDISFSELYEAGSPTRLMELMKRQRNDSMKEPIGNTSYNNTYFPLSWGQKQIYIAHMLAPQSANLNISFSVDIQGQLDEACLTKAFYLLIDRHEVLRTAIVWSENEPLQYIYPAAQILPPLTMKDLSLEKNAEVQAKDQGLIIANKPFNLEQAPLCRLYLAKIAPERYKMVFSIHHIISDGWSIQLIGKELAEMYDTLKSGGAIQHIQKIQYRDFVFWQQQLHLSEKYNTNRAFWHKYLEGNTNDIGIPANIREHASSENKSTKGSVYKTYYPKERTSDLIKLADQHNASFFSTIISALGLLINKYNYGNTNDFLIGIDTAGRTHPQLEDQIGYFLHTLPVRIKLNAEESFAGLLEATHKNLLTVYDHQTCYIDDIRDVNQNAPRFSTYRILVIFQNFEQELGFNDIFHDLKTHTEIIENDTCLNDLLFEFSIEDGTLCLKVKYSITLYDELYISGLCEHFYNILHEACTHPAARMDQISMLSMQEQKKALHIFNHTNVNFEFSDIDLINCFERQAAAYPDAIALVYGDEQMSYRELNIRANCITHHLLNLMSITKSQLVGISTGRNELLVIGLLGILKAGAAYLPVDPEYPIERIRYMIDNSGLQILLTENTQAYYKESIVTLGLKDASQIKIAEPIAHKTQSSRDDLAYVIYTSGSTGYPKGVMISRQSVSNYVHAFAEYFKINRNDKVILQSSIAFDTLVEELFPILLKGGMLILAADGGRNIDALLKLIVQWQVSLISVTPLVLNELNKHAESLGSLRTIISGGDELQSSYIDNLLHKIPVYNTYGPTETTVCATYFLVTDSSNTHFIGKPVANTQVYILNEHLHPQPVNVPGEICITGQGVAIGYLNNLPLTEERFVDNPYGPGKLYRTGDIARWREDGNIEFFGRSDNQVKIRGYRIELAEIEQCLIRSGLATHLAINVFEHKGEKKIVAYYTAESDKASEWREYAHAHLPYYMVPYFFVHLQHLPLTPNGKIDRKSLPPPEKKTNRHRAPETNTEKIIIGICEDVLDHNPIGLEDNFFEIGGQSLKAIQVISRIFKELSVKLELRDLFANPILEQLTEKVEVLLWINMPVTPDLSSNTDEIII